MDKSFHFITCQKKNDKELWISTSTGFAMATVNLENGKVHLLDGPSGFSLSNWGGSSCFIREDDFMILVEITGKRLLKYNSMDGSVQCYPLMDGYYNCSDINYLLAFLYNGYVWVFPKYENIIYAFDIATNKVEKYVIGFSEQEKEIYHEKPIFIKAKKNGFNVSLYSTILKCEIIFDLLTCSIRYEALPNNVGECLDIGIVGGAVYALTINNEVYSWQQKAFLADKILDFSIFENGFSRIVATKFNLWILPNRSDKIIVYDYKTKTCHEYRNYPDGFSFNGEIPEQARFYCSCDVGDVEYFSMCATSHMLHINKATGMADWTGLQGPSVEDYLNLYLNHKDNVVQESMLSLDAFLSVL